MPERKLPMRQIKEVLRLHHEAHLSERQIARGCRISRSSVQRYLERAAIANLSWPLPESLDDTQLDRLLFPPAPATVTDEGHRQPKPQPDFTKVHHELKSNKNVTLQLLWQEFVEQQWSPLQLVLPAVSRMDAASGCGVAAGSPSRRENVCRSRR